MTRGPTIPVAYARLHWRQVEGRTAVRLHGHSLQHCRNETREFRPFYGVGHGVAGGPQAFWHSTRRPSTHAGGQLDNATEVYLSPRTRWETEG